MSHELKTPLNAVLGFSEILRDQAFGPLGHPSYQGYAGDIHNSGAKLLAIINDVLDVSRLEGRNITLAEQECHPVDVAEQAVAAAQTLMRDMRPIALNVPLSLPAVCVDPQRLRQILINLLSNALKFTSPGDDISLRAWMDKQGAVCFAVEDKGIGMAPEKIAAALEPFRQLDRSLARRFEGAGLGLFIARALVDLHDGKLAIDSAVGLGTVVTISLPPSRTRIYAPAALSA
jgi:signal transduction histidine kinase